MIVEVSARLGSRIVAYTVLRYQVLGRLPGGRARLERWGVRTSERILARHYGRHPREIGALPA